MSTADEHHTMDELYDYRMAYHALAVREWSAQGITSYRSYFHQDGTVPFGDSGWFIVVTVLPTGQVSNHYPVKYFDMFNYAFPCIMKDTARKCLPEYDGHTPAEALDRIKRYITNDY